MELVEGSGGGPLLADLSGGGSLEGVEATGEVAAAVPAVCVSGGGILRTADVAAAARGLAAPSLAVPAAGLVDAARGVGGAAGSFAGTGSSVSCTYATGKIPFTSLPITRPLYHPEDSFNTSTVSFAYSVPQQS